ncbi:hypothetical protein SDC9_173781 [bioreactor metagenome]|uniref:Uncharacterized protein n=1 Tax=bioreactor metagenome TaxID=1076179 RepID=A0A645GHE7_9ZZZZ
MRKRRAAPAALPLEFAGEVFRELVDAADGRNDPEIVPDSGPAVGAAVTQESPPRLDARKRGDGNRRETVFLFARETGFEVVGMDETARRDVAKGMADRHVVLDDRLTRRNGAEREFMAAADRLRERDSHAVNNRNLSGGEVGEGDGDVVGASDLEIARKFAHIHASNSFRVAAEIPRERIAPRSAATASASPGTAFRSSPQKSVRERTARTNFPALPSASSVL